jgi:hypothetical protein
MLKQEKIDYILDRIADIIGSAKYLLIIDGLPKKHDGSFVWVKANRRDQSKKPEVLFFTEYATDGKRFEHFPTTLRSNILEKFVSADLFGFDFSEWLHKRERDVGPQVSIAANTGIKYLYFETSMYRIFKETVPVRNNLNLVFQPTISGGRFLNPVELSYLLNRFRVNGFASMAELDRMGIGRRIAGKLPDLYKNKTTHFLALLRERNLFNPLLNDMMIFDLIKNTKLMQLMLQKSVNYDASGTLSSTHLSVYEVCKNLNIVEDGKVVLVPMNYEILTKIIAGFVMDPDVVPVGIPHRSKIVYRNTGEEEFKPVITEKEYEAGSDYMKSWYVRTNSFNNFFLSNFVFFQSRGFRSSDRLLTIMNNATLL